jgi:hypothetical protein
MSAGAVGDPAPQGPTTPGAEAPPSSTVPSAPPPGPPSRRPTWTVVGAIVVVVVVVLGIGFEGLIPGVHIPGGKGSGGSGPSGAVPFSVARVAATNAADSLHGGTWSVVLAVALNSVDSFRFPAISPSNLSTGGCDFSPGAAAGLISVGAASGGVGQGSSPFWLFELTDPAAGGALVTVENGSAGVYGTLLGSACISALGNTYALTTPVVDSTTAVTSANAAGGATFLRSYPLANATLGIIGGLSLGPIPIPPTWVVSYSDCSITAGAAASGAEFAAEIDAASGAVEGASTTLASCPTLSSGFPSLGVGGSSPLSGALSIGASSAGNCTGTGSITCGYSFPVESATSGIVPIDMVFNLLNGTGRDAEGVFSNVTLLDHAGCRIATYSDAGVSAPVAGAAACASGATIYLPLNATDTIWLHTTARIGGQGYQLVVADAAYTGEVAASVT